MKKIILILIFLSLVSCSKPKTVFICGDHICVNKAEAQQYFEENLTLEVKVIKNKDPKELSLIELNMNESDKENKQVFAKKKIVTKKKIKELTSDEKKKIISKIKEKKVNKEIASRKTVKKNEKVSVNTKKNIITVNKIINKKKDTFDICKIIKECTIDEISKYLIKEGRKKNFPDITTRQ